MIKKQQTRAFEFWGGRQIALVLIFWLSACGIEEEFSIEPEPEFPVVRLAGPPEVRAVPNSYIVVFRNGGELRSFDGVRDEYRYYFSGLEETYHPDPRIKEIQYITAVNMNNPTAEPPAVSFGPPSLKLAWTAGADEPAELGVMARVDFHDPEGAASLLKEWERDGELWFADPNFVNELQVQDEEEENQGNDGYFTAVQQLAQAWWHKSISLAEAFGDISAKIADTSNTIDEQFVFSNPPVIAVLDSGVDVLHPLLKDNIFQNQRVGQALCDEDYNGCDTTRAVRGKFGRGSVHPYGLSGSGEACGDENPDIKKNCPHGTHVAGIAASIFRENDSQSGGICPYCKIMPIKVVTSIGGKGGAPDSAILNGLKYLTQFDASTNIRVANSSFGKYTRNRAVALAVSILKRGRNSILVVGAAGNEDSMLRVYPAALEDAVAVAAVQVNYQKAPYSNYGPWVDVSSPGGVGSGSQAAGSGIYSTVPGSTNPQGNRDYKSGTSMATPVTAGLAGLMLTINKDLNFNELRDRIIRTSNSATLYLASNGNGQAFNAQFYLRKPQGANIAAPLLGAGMINAKAAVAGGADTSILKPRERVQLGVCGVLSSPGAGTLVTLLFIGLLPLGLMLGSFLGHFQKRFL